MCSLGAHMNLYVLLCPQSFKPPFLDIVDAVIIDTLGITGSYMYSCIIKSSFCSLGNVYV